MRTSGAATSLPKSASTVSPATVVCPTATRGVAPAGR